MEPFTLFALIFVVATVSSGVLADAPKPPTPTDEEKLAKAIAKMLTKEPAASSDS